MSTASSVWRIIEALSKTKPPQMPGGVYTRLGNDTELLTIGVIVGIALAAIALLWSREKE